MQYVRINLRPGAILLFLAPAPVLIFLAACGTDFVEPAPVGVRSTEVAPQATVLRIVAVTPVATPTPVPTAAGPDGSVQRRFPPELDPSGEPLSSDMTLGLWKEYLSDSRLVIEGRAIDVHVCSNGTLLAGSSSSIISAGDWGLRAASGEWYETVLGRRFSANRISGFVRLSRIGEATVALGDELTVVSVTESDLCGEVGG